MSGRELRELESLSASPRRKRNATAGLANGDEPPTKYCAANPLDEAGAVAEEAYAMPPEAPELSDEHKAWAGIR